MNAKASPELCDFCVKYWYLENYNTTDLSLTLLKVDVHKAIVWQWPLPYESGIIFDYLILPFL